MEITKIFVIAVCCCVFSTLVSQFKPEFSVFVQLCCVVSVALLISDSAFELFSLTKDLTSTIKINNEYIYLLLKAVVIAVCGKVVCDICCDYGNRAVATCVDVACRFSVMLLAFPMLKVLLALATDLIKNEN